MTRIDERLKELGITLPEVVKPVAAYIPVIRTGNLVMTSGQLPMKDGAMAVTGPVGAGAISTEDAAKEARQACLNALAAVKSEIGSLDNVVKVVRVGVFVNSKPDYTEQPQVANGASLLLQEVFGEAGQHVRAAVGCSGLPRNAPVEVELTVEVR